MAGSSRESFLHLKVEGLKVQEGSQPPDLETVEPPTELPALGRGTASPWVLQVS